MKFISTRFLVVITTLLLAIPFLKAQESPAIYIDDIEVQPGETFDLDVKVLGYTDIISNAFTVEWNPDELAFVDILNIPTFLTNDNFNLTSVSTGKITFLYFDLSLQGNSLLDEETLFTMRMNNTIGEEDGQTAEVVFGGIMELVPMGSDTSLNTDFNGATITNGTVSTTDILGNAAPYFKADVLRNPFVDQAVVDLDMTNGGQLSWTLLDINGQVINNGTKSYAAGQNRLVLENTLFKHAGNYVLKLEIDGYTVTKKLLYVVP